MLKMDILTRDFNKCKQNKPAEGLSITACWGWFVGKFASMLLPGRACSGNPEGTRFVSPDKKK